MKRIITLVIVAVLLNACASGSHQARVQATDNLEKSTEARSQVKPQPSIVIEDELLNAPPENPQFVIAQVAAASTAEQAITKSIKQQLLRLGYVEAPSRDDANVVVWYSYDSKQTGLRQVGQAKDTWGEQLEPLALSDLGAVIPVSFKVQIVSLQESRFPHQVIPIWQGEWSSSLPELNMMEFSNETLSKVFEQYQSKETQNQIAAFQEAKERRVKRAMSTYMKMVMYRIQKNWQKPRYKVKGKKCKVKITQSAVGEIKSHKLLSCDKDRRFRRSIEKAIKASSPLPLPREHLFDRRELILIFQG